MRVFDLVLLAVALPVFLIAGLPFLGWVTGAVVWLMWRGIGAWADRRAHASDDPRVVAGYEAGGMIARGWIMGLTLLAVGLGAGSDVGLSAAGLDVILFTFFFTFKLIARPFDGPKEAKASPWRLPTPSSWPPAVPPLPW